jgi:murein L,D-transpeptidase YafK
VLGRAKVKNMTRSMILVAGFGALCASDSMAQHTLAPIVIVPEMAPGAFSSLTMPTDTASKKTSASAVVKSVAAALSGRKPKTNTFVQSQLEHERVLAARTEKRFQVKKVFRERGIPYPAAEIFLRAFKREHILELWVRPVNQEAFVLLKTYEICALTERPGPKRAQNDLQTPEGFYHVNNFNPQSGFHLSLGVNYPNEADVILNAKDGKSDGGDIFIHGGCKTAGCVALTDEAIKEVYVIAMEARDNGQTRIPVHIFPAHMTDEGLKQLARVFGKEDPSLVRFWTNLKTGYDYFENSRKLPMVSVNKRGRYLFRDPSEQIDRDVDKDLLGTLAADTALAPTVETRETLSAETGTQN